MRVGLRGGKEDVEESEESWSIPHMENRSIEKGVELVVEIRIFTEFLARHSSALHQQAESIDGTHRLCFCMRVNNPFKARIAIVPPRSAQSTNQSINLLGSVM